MVFKVENKHLTKVLDWIEKEKKNSLKISVEQWPKDYALISKMNFWFDQVLLKANENPPNQAVKQLIIEEDKDGIVNKVSYDYYSENESYNDDLSVHLISHSV